MLVIITGGDISFCNSLAEFLEKRSFHKKVIYNADYPLAGRATALLEECGVIVRRYP